jgi:hypothetical protein
MNKEDLIGPVLMAVSVLLVVSGIIAIVVDVTSKADNDQQCEERGGKFVVLRPNGLCLDKNLFR